MMDMGEQIIGAWLRELAQCDIVEYSIRTEGQGEIDVVGLNLRENRAYLCEAATHIQGIWYADTTEKEANKIVEKFQRASQWANSHLHEFPHRTFMLWTPVIRSQLPTVKHNQADSIEQAKARLKQEVGVDLEVVANLSYKMKLKQLRGIARDRTSNLNSPVLRLMQIEEWNRKYAND